MSLLLWTARSIVAAQQRVLDFLHEQALAADLRERRLLQPVAARLDDDDLARRSARSSTRAAARARLPERELTAAGAEAELVHADLPVAGAGRRAGEPRSGPASALAAVRRRRARTARVERVGVRAHAGRVVDGLELFGRREQQLLDHQPGDLVDARPRLGRQPGELRLRAARARPGGSPRTAAAARRRSEWRRATVSQASNFRTSSATIPSARATSAGAARQVLLHDRLQVVDVVEEDRSRSPTAGSTSRGTAMSMRNSGRLRRCRITASTCGRVRTGSVAPVAVMTMSAAASAPRSLVPRQRPCRRSTRPAPSRARSVRLVISSRSHALRLAGAAR